MIDMIRLHSMTRHSEIKKLFETKKFDTSSGTFFISQEEVSYPYEAHFHGFKIRLTPKRVFVSGSIHKYFNSVKGKGIQNHNELDFGELIEAIDHLLSYLPSLVDFQITGLEFGFNLNLGNLGVDVPISELIQQFLFYNWAVAPKYEKYDNNGYMRVFERDNYLFKVYDKSAQFYIKDPILRIELKLKDKREYADFDIYNLGDLKRISSMLCLWKLYIQRFNDLMILDKVPIKPRSKWQSTFFQSTNLDYWNSFKLSQKNTKTKKKKEAIKFFKEKDLLKTKKLLRKELGLKFYKLMKPAFRNGINSTYIDSRKLPQIKI